MKMEFHHIGIPSAKVRADEIYLAEGKLFITDCGKSEHHIEWLRFENDSPMPAALKNTAHAAFTVDNLEAALKGKKVIVEPWSPMAGLRVAFVQEGDAPIEYLEFSKT
jgi:hypothetical protein